ncbi:MAG: serine/threonine protein kinase [Candidatus Riflebacteria bacterium]|nr:serine/threonine protein kinase [Candidatus Riflebacteria bacterium]
MQVGDRIGRYRIVRPLGEGGMAAVFLGEDPEHQREVVIKILPPHLNNEAMTARFLREIQAIARLSHPNVVKVLDYSVDEAQSFYVMPFLPVDDFRACWTAIKGEHRFLPILSYSKVRSILLDVASALAHCHEKQLLHRDIKPENILVEREAGRGILSDFGVARAADLTNLTTSRAMVGTLSYMSPEQVQGHEIGPASDLYQLALVVYEAYTSTLPLMGQTPMETATRRIHEPIPSPREINPALSEELSRFLTHCLDAEPGRRPRSLTAFHEALRTLPIESRTPRAATSLSGELRAYSVSREMSLTTLRRQAEDRRKRIIAGVGVAAALVAVTLWFTLRGSPGRLQVLPSYQSAAITAPDGGDLKIEVSGPPFGRATFDPRLDPGVGWRAVIQGLVPGESYSCRWVRGTRAGPPVTFKTKEAKLLSTRQELRGDSLWVSFSTNAPFVAGVYFRGDDETGATGLSTAPALQHQGTIPLHHGRAAELMAVLTDPGGDRARLSFGEVLSPATLAHRLQLALDDLKPGQVQETLRDARLARRSDREKLAQRLKSGVLRGALAALHTFRPLGPAYFGDRTVPLEERVRLYRALSKLSLLELELAAGSVPLTFAVQGVLGDRFSLSPADRLAGARTIEIPVGDDGRELMVDYRKLVKRAGKSANKLLETFADATDRAQSTCDYTVDVRGLDRRTVAQVTLAARGWDDLAYLEMAVNGKADLLFVPAPGRKEGEKDPITLYHTFDPACLKEGTNVLRVQIRVIGDWYLDRKRVKLGFADLKVR